MLHLSHLRVVQRSQAQHLDHAVQSLQILVPGLVQDVEVERWNVLLPFSFLPRRERQRFIHLARRPKQQFRSFLPAKILQKVNYHVHPLLYY